MSNAKAYSVGAITHQEYIEKKRKLKKVMPRMERAQGFFTRRNK